MLLLLCECVINSIVQNLRDFFRKFWNKKTDLNSKNECRKKAEENKSQWPESLFVLHAAAHLGAQGGRCPRLCTGKYLYNIFFKRVKNIPIRIVIFFMLKFTGTTLKPKQMPDYCSQECSNKVKKYCKEAYCSLCNTTYGAQEGRCPTCCARKNKCRMCSNLLTEIQTPTPKENSSDVQLEKRPNQKTAAEKEKTRRHKELLMGKKKTTCNIS